MTIGPAPMMKMRLMSVRFGMNPCFTPKALKIQEQRTKSPRRNDMAAKRPPLSSESPDTDGIGNFVVCFLISSLA